MTGRPTLGFSQLQKNEFSTGPSDKLRRVGFLLVALVLVGGLFAYLTSAVQNSTAHATSDNSSLHYDPN